MLRTQQNKNIQAGTVRINACIFNDTSLLVRNTLLPIVYLDFSDRCTYIVQLFKFQDCIVAHNVSSFLIMKSLLEVENSKAQVIILYTWRQYVIDYNNQLYLARINQISKYVLADVVDISPIRSPTHEVKPVKIFLSPSKKCSKRIRSVFEHDE
ncbi:hypothetical protein BD770DRAFT_458130 [Pilaira anomala]|nr:hypothetical protein BD770DRAFT_458130 [Pilaira anomala]